MAGTITRVIIRWVTGHHEVYEATEVDLSKHNLLIMKLVDNTVAHIAIEGVIYSFVTSIEPQSSDTDPYPNDAIARLKSFGL